MIAESVQRVLGGTARVVISARSSVPSSAGRRVTNPPRRGLAGEATPIPRRRSPRAYSPYGPRLLRFPMATAGRERLTIAHERPLAADAGDATTSPRR